MIRPLLASLWCLWGLTTAPIALAQIVADPTAPASQQPTVGAAGNGVPLVNIRTPSPAGVSRNTYSQFDVQQQGAILNNARTNAQTQLGGWVQGNPHLAGGSARIILNEVNSSNPSQLGGHVEVAGSRAEVVIANPAGVTCNGCGFINASRATLTTGTPIVNGGNLEGYRVERGKVAVQGDGLDASSADYTDIIARAVEVNAGIWARQLKVTAGANRVDAQNTVATPIAGDGAAPEVAIDVARLGGMYANKIVLVGGEAGVGVRNAGHLGAAAGEIRVTADGRIENSGVMQAAGALALSAGGDVTNSGTLYARGDQELAAGGSIGNAGIVAARGDVRLMAGGRIDSAAGSVLAAGLDEDGTLGFSGDLAATAGEALISKGQSVAGNSLNLSAARLDLSDGLVGAGDVYLQAGEGGLDARRAVIVADQALEMRSGQGLDAREAQIAGGALEIRARSIDNRQGRLVQAGNNAGAIQADTRLDNRDGVIASRGGSLAITASTLDNGGGLIAAPDGVLEIAASTLDNGAGGEIVARDTRLTVPGTLTNRGLIDGNDVLLKTPALENLGSGRIYGGHLAIEAGTLTNAAEEGRAPVIAARERLDIGANAISNSGQAIIYSDGDLGMGGSLDAARQAQGRAATINNDGATIEAAGSAEISARTVNNTNPDFSTTTEIVRTESVTEYAGAGSPNRYAPNAPGVYLFDNESIYLHTPEGNYEEWKAYSYTRTTTETRVASSEPAQILSGAQMRINAETLNNDKSRIIAGGTLSGDIGALINIEVAGERTITDAGTATSYWRKHRKGRDTTGVSVEAYNPAPTVQAISLTPTVFQGNAEPAGHAPGGRAVTPITQIALPLGGDDEAARTVVRSGGISVSVPGSSLYMVHPESTARYLVEADPRFADYRTWISSDWMLAQLGLDPALSQKRMGDGFYEQRLLREQVASLTGRRFLDGYASDEAQYQALMAAGVSYASEWNLVPGVALTAEQMARLTSDIVWLVEKEVRLADGGTTRALVPQLYVRVREGDLQSGGALIAGNDVRLGLAGDLVNSGTIAANRVLAIDAENIRNLQGRLLGNDIGLSARTDFDNIGGTIAANNSLLAVAGRDLNAVSPTRAQAGPQGGRVNIERVATMQVTGAAGELVAAAGRDINLIAAAIHNAAPAAPDTPAGSTTISAGNNLKLGTVAESSSERIVWDGSNHLSESRRTDVGTSIQSRGELVLRAGNNLNARGAEATSSEGGLAVIAGSDITLAAGEANVQIDEAHKHKGRSSAFASKTVTTRDTLDQTSALPSAFSGQHVSVLAGRDIALSGANIVSDEATSLAAGGNITIEAAAESHDERHEKTTKKSGIFSSGGFGITIGSQSLAKKLDDESLTSAPSTVGSIAGDVLIEAGGNYRQTGSDLLAPAGDIAVAARRIDIDEARDVRTIRQEVKAKQSGLTVSLSSPVISAVQTAQAMSQAAKDAPGGRMGALAAASAGLTAYNTASAMQAGQGRPMTDSDGVVRDNQIPVTDGQGNIVGSRDANVADQAGGISLNISLGSSKSQSKSVQVIESAAGSSLVAGGDITLAASGAGAESDLTLQGSRAQAGRNLALLAEGEVRLLAARNQSTLEASNKSSSGSIGVSFGSGGIAITASASKSKGNASGNDTQYANAEASAGDTLYLVSGGDTTLRGATAAGQRVVADIGGNLVIESLQDESHYRSRQSSSGFSLSVPIAGGLPSGSLSAGKSAIDSDYRSVSQQSAIRAGDGGFDIRVAGDTTLTGGAITSTQQAVDEGRNRFETGGALALADIGNRAEYQGKALAVNLGSGFDPAGRLVPQGSGAGTGKAEGSAASATTAAISGLAGDTAARTGDGEAGIAPIFDPDKAQRQIDAQVQITQAFGTSASKAIGDWAQAQIRLADGLRAQAVQEKDEGARAALMTRANEIDSLWGDAGSLRLAAHAVVGGLSGGLQGAAGSAIGSAVAPMVADALRKAGIGGPLAATLTALASTASGAAAGGTAGSAAAFDEVGNNYLSHMENEDRARARASCIGGNGDACIRAAALDELDQARDRQFHELCDGELRNTAACAGETQKMFEFLATFAQPAARVAAASDKGSVLTLEHRDELQSYLKLIATANEDVRSSVQEKFRNPEKYDADPYGVIDKNNLKNAYLVMKFGTEALVIANVLQDGVYNIVTHDWARNGMGSDPSYAAGIMFTHVDAAAETKHNVDDEKNETRTPYIPVDRYILSYAPTEGFFSDLLGALGTKLGYESEAVLGLRKQLEAIEASGTKVNWVVFSRGGLDFVQAAAGSSEESLSNNAVVYHAAANTRSSAESVAKNKGIRDVINDKLRFRDNPNDPVPQLAGLHATEEPVNFLQSLFNLPCLSRLACSIEEGPHSLPADWNKLEKEAE
ncbi:MAG TPA: hemagglutinin repeat-containing protein [Candidatus Desulfobacillus sp.]|nr:hemagglutinin repeat-containing protein [Candidatus Desulfobacillus sp.]